MKHWIDRNVLSFWTDKDKKIEAAHLLDLCDTVIEDSVTVWTPFLSAAVSNWLEDVLRRESLKYRIVGGFPESERTRLVIGKDEDDFKRLKNEIVILAVRPTIPNRRLEHRQILGSLMGLRIKREHIGDILLSQQGVYVAVSQEIAEVLVREWKQAGREKIKVERIDSELDIQPDPGEECRITVQSSRLDAVAASGFHLSRSVFKELIVQGKVKRNDLVVLKSDTEVKPGDRITCRGYGRIRLIESSETRKGRIAWNILIYRPKRHG